MELTLRRIYLGPEYTIGKLYIDGVYYCDTLEDKNRDLNKNGKFDNGEKKVKDETCIPFGIYEVQITWSPKFKRWMPQIMNVPEFEGIRIHSGSNKNHTSGCILLGKNTVKGGLTDSKITCEDFYIRLNIAINNKERIMITIV